MNYLLDTNICIFHLRGKLNLSKIKQEKKANFFISEITLLELFYGCEKSLDTRESYQAVKKFLEDIKILPIGNCAEKYASLKNNLFKIGKPLHNEFDLLIAVTAIINKMILVTDNFKDFRNIEEVTIENWIER